jgi:hypothetical protein
MSIYNVHGTCILKKRKHQRRWPPAVVVKTVHQKIRVHTYMYRGYKHPLSEAMTNLPRALQKRTAAWLTDPQWSQNCTETGLLPLWWLLKSMLHMRHVRWPSPKCFFLFCSCFINSTLKKQKIIRSMMYICIAHVYHSQLWFGKGRHTYMLQMDTHYRGSPHPC